tara:strand:+ start:192 stop:365 length:174 start_codon:yes stop_codon:yes gene_type:complete
MIIEMLLYTTLTCAQVNQLIDKVIENDQSGMLSKVEVQEVIDVLKDSSPECFNEGPK